MATVTATHIARVTKDWTEYAGEPVTIDPSLLGTTISPTMPITAFGSELACLRLHYRLTKGRVEYSKNLGTWFYVSA